MAWYRFLLTFDHVSGIRELYVLNLHVHVDVILIEKIIDQA